ncbi:cysteine proteinase [Exidia glandulosa HHB12029]|uniref:Cysteine proteinase n=1 Tax=Exidia glandulosa HHB12029 TaxID=1314781 RepID=A0A165GVE0_EXIGL|nr:cysteine proteinase [Exidia glandulosa HHB12029]
MAKKSKKSPSPLPPPPPPPAGDVGDDLVDDLWAELDDRNGDASVKREASVVLQQVTMVQAQQSAGKKDSKARFKAREARKAAALADKFAPNDADADARLQEEIKNEKRIMEQVCDDYGLELHEINPDGHCLFSAIADQLALLGLLPANAANFATTRLAAAQYMYSHEDDFLPFLPSIEGEDGAGATSSGLMTHQQFSSYCATIRDTGAWGGEPEIQALSRAYKIPIFVVQAEKPHIVPHMPPAVTAEMGDPNVVRISYHRRMYGLGEHYNSLRPKASRMHRAVDSVKAAFT